MPKDISSENGNNANASNAAANSAAAARAEVFDALRQEMELADYCTAPSGYKVRRVPRNQVSKRETKRKALLEADMIEMAIEADDDDCGERAVGGGVAKKRRKRLRGTKVAFEDVVLKSMPTKVAFDDVVLKSMPLAKKIKKTESMPLAKNIKKTERANENVNKEPDEHENREDEDFAVEQNERYDMLKEVASLGIDLGFDEVEKIDDFEEEEEEVEEDGLDYDEIDYDETKNAGSECDETKDDQDEEETKTESPRKSGDNGRILVSKTGLIKPTKMTKRLMHRLRDFTSQRLAQKHGEAIGAHIRGMSTTAVQKLREVAKSAPGAPQVYSSLGMVFESMLTEVEGGGPEQGENETEENETEENSQLNHIQRRLELAQKAYASYHIASLLCKRDFVLWERSGDAALKGAQIYSEIIDHMANNPMASWGVSEEAVPSEDTTTRKGFDPNAGPEKWNSDRKLWLEHALAAYQSSDNLRPPGVDVPCKLAQVHMSLGSYIDALSILTDLRNMAGGNSLGGKNGLVRELGRSEMEGSYPCWLLYADLMMKIGYECKHWNEGTSTNQNKMFKRWLRKNSKGFDWQERRLQALCLALEAAAGSASCTNLIKWMRERAEKFLDKNEKEVADVENDADDNAMNNDPQEAKENTTDKDESRTTKSTYEKEREKLLNMNKVELHKFDRMTKEMNLVAGSHISKNRIAVRVALVEKHRTAIKDLAMREYTEEQENTPANLEASANNEQPDLSEVELSPKPLPLHGSRATVYDIAALLLKQCIQLRLFKGGLLAVQSVLDYSKERVSRHERLMELQRENELLRNSDQGLGLGFGSGFKYDQINFESDDDEGLGTFIADDEDLEQPGVLQLLKRGKLPVDIRAMQAICLLGAGGQDYIALTYAEQVILSNELDLSDEDISPDVSSTDDPRLLTFSKYLHAPIDNSFLLSSIADLVTENVKVHPQSYRVLSILRKYFLTKIVDINQGLDFDEVLSSPKELERVHATKTLLATLKLLIDCARMDLALMDGPGKEEVKTVEQAVTDSIYVLKTMTRFQYLLWNPCFADWSLPQSSIDMVSVLSGAISILVQAASLVEDKGVLDSVQVGLMKSRQLISTICQADNPPFKPTASSNAETWRSFPLSCSWQTSFHEKISLRAYNLCVASCVSSFSGWEPSEFNLDQLRTSETNFFGVTFEGPCVAGSLPDNAASAVTEQWDYISQILPDLEELPFEAHLDDRKKMSWYRNVEKQGIPSSKISTYGEEDGIRALLSFSTLCLIAAEESEGDEKDEFLKLSMSVLLPMTQFSIDKQVWQSTIGTLAMTSRNETKVGYYLDENCHWLGPTKTKQGRTQYANKPQRLPRTPEVARPTRERSQATNVVRVPTSVLLEEWRKDDAVVERRFALEDAQRAMKKLDDAMKNLRKSRTLNSLEQASIDASVALISLVNYDECHNPFVCMLQAAMFAAMGSKRGNNDEPFKRFLPLKKKCTPLEALNVVCRADCLRAVHFLHEAQYLCTWVASVCQAHRDRLKEELPWNSRWRVIGILTHIVAATIDETGDALSLDDPHAGALRKWEEVAKEEISRGKSDALVLVTMNGGNPSEVTLNVAPANGENLLVEREGPGTEVPLRNNQNDITETNHQFGYHNALPGLNVAQYLNEGLNEPETMEDGDDDNPFAGIEAVDEDDYDPFAGVEVVGI